MRQDGRALDALRPVIMTPGYVIHPEGSVLIEIGQTRVLCNATVEGRVPRWRVKSGYGWVTAEYALLPRATQERTQRETSGLRGRTQEIRRLIGRSLRMAVDLRHLGQRQVIVDCDVIQADGGTRTAAVTGGYVAVVLALRGLIAAEAVPPAVLRRQVAAVSVGVVDNEAMLDLCYEEDKRAQADLNIVMTGAGEYVEVQGTAERAPFDRGMVNRLLDLAEVGISQLLDMQRRVLSGEDG
ncbi:MAG TPA: ribonuclease PH [Anaerolineae bacterium]|nr:ribonuclease PH [Anaerolineae bacterium]